MSYVDTYVVQTTTSSLCFLLPPRLSLNGPLIFNEPFNRLDRVPHPHFGQEEANAIGWATDEKEHERKCLAANDVKDLNNLK